IIRLINISIACVRVNESCTDWFPTPSGVKQGDALSPTLFAMFINDLAKEMKHIFSYADDIILTAETEQDLQNMLLCAVNWRKRWRLMINQTKTQVMHLGPGHLMQHSITLLLGQIALTQPGGVLDHCPVEK
uniref:ribonuclease H n=1 Tax=Oncorhynchus tshawytscha TaxID=74940 RepID=A0AAZ3NW60_ONCTS